MVEKRDDNIRERDKLMTLVSNERIPSPRPYAFLIDEFVPQLLTNDEDQIYIYLYKKKYKTKQCHFMLH